MVSHEMVEVARLWVAACKRERLASGEVYYSEAGDSDTEFIITAFDYEGNMHQMYANREES